MSDSSETSKRGNLQETVLKKLLRKVENYMNLSVVMCCCKSHRYIIVMNTMLRLSKFLKTKEIF